MFLCPEVSTLLVSVAVVSPDPTKTIKLSQCSYAPTDVKQLKQFLGLANYYHQFVTDYSKIAELFMSYFERKHLQLDPSLS